MSSMNWSINEMEYFMENPAQRLTVNSFCFATVVHCHRRQCGSFLIASPNVQAN
jgi:hypothetical protein